MKKIIGFELIFFPVLIIGLFFGAGLALFDPNWFVAAGTIFLGFAAISVPFIERWASKIYMKKEMSTAILSELKYLSVRLASSCHRIQIYFGNYGKKDLTWINEILKNYGDESYLGITKAIDSLLEVKEAQFKNLISVYKSEGKSGLSLKKYSLPFIESILKDLGVFDANIQKEVLYVRDRLDILNEEIEFAMFFYKLSFDPSVMEANNQGVNANINKSYQVICDLEKGITEDIEKIIKKLGNEKEKQ